MPRRGGKNSMDNPDLVVSLGPNCKNTWNTRSYFNVETAYPFDWWITPAKSMLRMLDRNFEFIAEADDLFITDTVNNSNSVYNKKLNLLHHHDFPRRKNLVTEVTPAAVEELNSRYRFLFSRFWKHMDAARAPLVLLNGIHAGWQFNVPSGGKNEALNGPMQPQDLVDAVRASLGEKTFVAIINIDKESRTDLDGGVVISRPDRGIREGLPPEKSYAEPVHVFREVYAALNLHPVVPEKEKSKPEVAAR
jgi:hypothetical protein